MIKMDVLQKLYIDLKFKNVQTYIQSGNVIFVSSQTKVSLLETKISKKIKEVFGFDVPVLIKEASELKEILKNNPFVKKCKENSKPLHVTFLSDKPLKENIEKIKEIKFPPDDYLLDGKIIYLYCPNGYGQTKLTNNFFENKLKVTATTRNWNTINELINLSKQ